jgi:tRNA-dihydrouridine synthase B
MAPPPTISPIHLGPVRIEFPVALAAMSGYTDWPTRTIARRLGAGYTICEVMLDQFILNVTRGKKARRYLRVTDEDHPAGAQLMGSSADEFAAAALKLVAAGFDVIDLNFGCPVKKVLGKCRGGYLLSQPQKALEIVARVREALPPHVPLTLKMRRGMDDTPESRDRFFAIFDGALALGVAAITVHGRTVRQRYEGRSSWEFVREAKARAGQRVIFGSGDLFTAEECVAMVAQTGVDGITVARGAIGNPWIFRDICGLAAGQPLPEGKGGQVQFAGTARRVLRTNWTCPPFPTPSLFEQREVMAEHYRLAEEAYGPKRAFSVMYTHGIKYSRLHPQAEQVRDAFVAVRRAAEWWKVLEQWYG